MSTAGAALSACIAWAAGETLWARGQARRDAVKARRALGEPRRDLSGVAEGERVTLAGVLATHGPLCPSFDDGRLVAATTATGAAGTASARAEQILLQTADGEVAILGPIVVHGGSSEARPGAALEKLSLAVCRRLVDAGAGADLRGEVALRSLRAGDRVRACGVLRRVAPDGAHAYREAAAPWALTADAASPAVALAFEGTPRVYGATLSLVSGLRDARRPVAAVVVATLIGGGALGALAWRPDPGAVPVPPTPVAHRLRGDGCERLRQAYAGALSSSCTADQDCTGEIRGQQWTGLDGCFRFRDRRVSSAAADRIAADWLGGGCAETYDVCSIAPQAMCRAGRCVERPPAPVPEDWTRQSFAHAFTFFVPPEVKDQGPQRSCTGGLHGLVRGDGMRIELVYDNGMEAPARAAELSIGGVPALVATREQTDDEIASLHGRYEAVAFFPATAGDTAAPPPTLWGSGTGSFALQVTGSGRTRADREVALAVIRSIRRW